VESFNRDVKSAYTGRELLNPIPLLTVLIEMVEALSSIHAKEFSMLREWDPVRVKQARELAAKGRFKIAVDDYRRGRTVTLLNVESNAVYRVDFRNNSCVCASYGKWLQCVHLPIAAKLQNVQVDGVPDIRELQPRKRAGGRLAPVNVSGRRKKARMALEE
jgi:hypothetical protein